MKLPNRKKAYVQKEKLVSYLLLEAHPIGSSKAKFFRQLGFSETNMGELVEALLRIAQSNDIKGTRKFEYGVNYVINGVIETPLVKSVAITSVWFIGKDENRPRFVTAYPV